MSWIVKNGLLNIAEPFPFRYRRRLARFTRVNRLKHRHIALNPTSWRNTSPMRPGVRLTAPVWTPSPRLPTGLDHLE